MRSLKKFVLVSRSGFLTLEVTLDYHDDDILPPSENTCRRNGCI